MDQIYETMKNSLISIGTELFRFHRVFEKATSKLEMDERNKYISQYAWFSKKVQKALEEADLKLLNLEGQAYDPGMAVTPINLEEFDTDDDLYVYQMIEPIVMQGSTVCKTGTVILGRVDE